ncbi:MAG: hypothetical protein EP329_22900 [Deltaproteobacteria bacterium]|nr:MAG: hypothetical protein EP329_22900 [Deltaproteobacteria bacterium]
MSRASHRGGFLLAFGAAILMQACVVVHHRTFLLREQVERSVLLPEAVDEEAPWRPGATTVVVLRDGSRQTVGDAVASRRGDTLTLHDGADGAVSFPIATVASVDTRVVVESQRTDLGETGEVRLAPGSLLAFFVLGGLGLLILCAAMSFEGPSFDIKMGR